MSSISQRIEFETEHGLGGVFNPGNHPTDITHLENRSWVPCGLKLNAVNIQIVNQFKIPVTSWDNGPAFEVPVIDEERRARDEAIINFFERSHHILNAYQAHQKTGKQKEMSKRAMQLALGFHLAAGADGPAELARRCGVDKQTLGKCLNHFIQQLSLEPLPCQRNREARKNMSEARKSQVEQSP